MQATSAHFARTVSSVAVRGRVLVIPQVRLPDASGQSQEPTELVAEGSSPAALGEAVGRMLLHSHVAGPNEATPQLEIETLFPILCVADWDEYDSLSHTVEVTEVDPPRASN
jgi:hypothetical protein